MTSIAATLSAVCLIGACASSASAQDVRANEWSRGTTLSGFAGVAIDSEESGPVIGGTVGWALTPRLAIEGSGSWTEFGGRANAFAGAMQLRIRLADFRPADPFFHAGIGLYRATFGPGERAVPEFYGHRERMARQASPVRRDVTFTDPTVVFGGGVDVVLNRQFVIRPDTEVTVVVRDRRSHVVTSAAVHLILRFESH